jgi:NAD(P)H-nitrite reductase large subunit
MKSYIIIGNGIAAAGCIEGIRSVDNSGKITVISEENHPVYCRPLISYYLENKTDLKKINYRDDDFYDKMNCKVLYKKRAVKIDTKTKNVILDDEKKLAYSSVCIATGSSPFVPPFEGLETVTHKHSFMTLDDTLALEKDLTKNSKVLIVGAGLIGLKCAEGILNRVKSVTVCDLADRVLSSILDTQCAQLMQTHLENHGIRFLLKDSAVRFEKNKAIMKSGTTVDFDVLVLAVGVRANTLLAKDAGAQVNRGIIVNTKLETTVPDIYACGDCTEGYDVSLGQNRVLAILPNAYMQGRTAGINMAKGNAVFDNAIPMNSIGFFDLHAMTAGTYDGEMYEEKTEKSIKRLFTKNDYLTGFILIGCNEKAGIYTSLIREKIPLSSLNFELMKHGATTAAFPSTIRNKKFGGQI